MADLGAVVGIDLGTTMSVISHLDSSYAAATIPNREGDPLTPSAVYLDGSDAIVGKAAKDAAAHYPEKVATLIKRYIGTPLFRDGQEIDGRSFRPETLSAIILRKMKQDAERRIGTISKAVITVPAFFDDARRKATEDAGRIAGLEVLDIVNEPTAAALAFSLDGRLGPSANKVAPPFEGSLTALVYDLGGGTFDVTAVRLAGKEFETLATDGEVQLGGRDWDEQIIDYIGEQFEQQHGVNPAQDAIRRAAISNLAETAKKLLSQLPSAPLECFHEGQVLQTKIDINTFNEMTANLLARSEIVTDLVVKQAGLSWDKIERVLLVGGSTRMPAVREMLTSLTGMEPDDSLDPDQVVSHGAAIFGAIQASKSDEAELVLDEDLEKELKDVIVQDVNAHSLGVQTIDRRKKLMNSVMIQKNTQLPYAASKVYYLNKAGAMSVSVKVLEGEAARAEDNILMGKCRVENLPPGLPIKSPIQVRLGFDTKGCVEVMALDMTGGRNATAVFQRQNGLTDSDIERETAWVNSLKIQ